MGRGASHLSSGKSVCCNPHEVGQYRLESALQLLERFSWTHLCCCKPCSNCSEAQRQSSATWQPSRAKLVTDLRSVSSGLDRGRGSSKTTSQLWLSADCSLVTSLVDFAQGGRVVVESHVTTRSNSLPHEEVRAIRFELASVGFAVSGCTQRHQTECGRTGRCRPRRARTLNPQRTQPSMLLSMSGDCLALASSERGPRVV